MICSNSDLLLAPMLHTTFQFNLTGGPEEEVKIDFQDGCHSGHIGYQINTICKT